MLPTQPTLPSLSTPRNLSHPDPSPSPSHTSESIALSFFSLEGAGLALSCCQFTQQEFVERLVKLSRDPDPTISLPALKSLQSFLLTTVKLSGLVARTTTTLSQPLEKPDGTAQVASITTSSLLTRLRPSVPPSSYGPGVTHADPSA